MAKHRKQHINPQCCLRRFANDDGNLICFDKVTSKTYPTTTLAAAQEKHFYDFPPDAFPGMEVDRQYVEKTLSKIEGVFGPFLGEIIASADAGGITHGQIAEFSPYVVIQWMRTKWWRDVSCEIDQKGCQALVDLLFALNFPGERCKLRFVPEHQMSVDHARSMFDAERVKRMGRELECLLWVVGINDTAHPFYTSDHPVVRRGNCHTDGIAMVGVDAPGVEFVYPLSSRHVLLIMERRHFAGWRKHDTRAVWLTEEQVRDYNRLQVMRCFQKLYCRIDDFDLAREVCEQHPEVRDPNRPRVQVEVTPIKDMTNQIIMTALE